MSTLPGSTGISASQAHRHGTHYFAYLTFRVEDVLFNVPRYRFEQNAEGIFAAALTLPAGDSTKTEGRSDENPIVLEGISSADFEPFIAVLYPLDTPPEYKLSKDEWISVLKLSTLWNFLDLRKLAISRLKTLEMKPAERIVLGREHSVVFFLRSGYSALMRSAEGISNEDAQMVGWETALAVYRARERFLVQNSGLGSGAFRRTPHVNSLDEFAEELRRVGDEGQTYGDDINEGDAAWDPEPVINVPHRMKTHPTPW